LFAVEQKFTKTVASLLNLNENVIK